MRTKIYEYTRDEYYGLLAADKPYVLRNLYCVYPVVSGEPDTVDWYECYISDFSFQFPSSIHSAYNADRALMNLYIMQRAGYKYVSFKTYCWARDDASKAKITVAKAIKRLEGMLRTHAGKPFCGGHVNTLEKVREDAEREWKFVGGLQRNGVCRHRCAVEDALRKGIYVPENVLEESYPEFVGKSAESMKHSNRIRTHHRSLGTAYLDMKSNKSTLEMGIAHVIFKTPQYVGGPREVYIPYYLDWPGDFTTWRLRKDTEKIKYGGYDGYKETGTIIRTLLFPRVATGENKV